MPLSTNETYTRLIETLKDMGVQAQQKTSDADQYKAFLAAFPLSRLHGLTAGEYCLGKGGNDSFCWWLERGLERCLGRYMPGNARGHILYFKPDGTLYKHGRLQALSDIEALSYTLKIQAAIAAAATSDALWIDEDAQVYQHAGVAELVTVGEGRKLRLLCCYHPEETLPISSTDHLKHFLLALGCPPDEIPTAKKPVARMQLLWRYFLAAAEQVNGISPLGFVRALYSPALAIAPVRIAADPTPADNGKSSAASAAVVVEQVPLNQILFGPPGTGKTHETVVEALRILAPDFLDANRGSRKSLKDRFDQLVSSEHIRFVTFHQSFSYEDFVEGLRAYSDDEGQLRYEIADGVFKQLCDAARTEVKGSAAAPLDLTGHNIWKMSLGSPKGADAYIYEECIEQ